jgi:hypothetical protein
MAKQRFKRIGVPMDVSDNVVVHENSGWLLKGNPGT